MRPSMTAHPNLRAAPGAKTTFGQPPHCCVARAWQTTLRRNWPCPARRDRGTAFDGTDVVRRVSRKWADTSRLIVPNIGQGDQTII